MKITNIEELYSAFGPPWVESVISHDEPLLREVRLVYGDPNPDNFWIWREAFRVYTNVYIPVPENILCPDPKHFTHFLHRSAKNPALIAYTPDEETGKRDIQISTRIGKYVTTFYPGVNAKLISNHYMMLSAPPTLKFAKTREEIRTLYDGGPQSCMKCKRIEAQDEDEPISPVEVYAGPDTAVAYIGELKHSSARAVVNTVRNHWVRIYGDDSYLKEILEKAGYSHGDLRNCRVLRFLQPYGDPIMPYLDGVQGCYDDGDYIVIVNEDDDRCEYICDQQNGTVSVKRDENSMCCSDCEEYLNSEDDGSYLDHGWVCDNCLSEYYTWAHVNRYQHAWINNESEALYEYDGDYYTSYALEQHNLYLIGDSDVVYNADEVTTDLASGEIIVIEDSLRAKSSHEEGYVNPDNLYPEQNDFYFDMEEQIVYINILEEEADDLGLLSVSDLITRYPEINHSWETPDDISDYRFSKAIACTVVHALIHQRNRARHSNREYLRTINLPGSLWDFRLQEATFVRI